MDSYFPLASSKTGDRYESLWRECARMIMAEFNCWESQPRESWKDPSIDPCQKHKASALSCVEKSLDWESWDELLKCRERQRSMAAFKEKNSKAPEPISCREQAIACKANRDQLFNNLLTPEVTEFTKIIDVARSKCKELKLAYWKCTETLSDQSIECLDLDILVKDCMLSQLAPEEYKAYDNCRRSNPSSPCNEEKKQAMVKIDDMALDATRSLGLRKLDFLRYGGPYKTYETMIYPLLHLGGFHSVVTPQEQPKSGSSGLFSWFSSTKE